MPGPEPMTHAGVSTRHGAIPYPARPWIGAAHKGTASTCALWDPDPEPGARSMRPALRAAPKPITSLRTPCLAWLRRRQAKEPRRQAGQPAGAAVGPTRGCFDYCQELGGQRWPAWRCARSRLQRDRVCPSTRAGHGTASAHAQSMPCRPALGILAGLRRCAAAAERDGNALQGREGLSARGLWVSAGTSAATRCGCRALQAG